MTPSERMSTRQSLTCEDYLVMDDSTLKTLPKGKLYEIIYRFDTEVDALKKNAEFASAQMNEKATEIAELQEQVDFVKKTNQLLSSELLSAHQSNSENKKKLEEALNVLKEYARMDNHPPSDKSYHVLKLNLEETKRKKKRLRQELQEFQVKTRNMLKEITSLQEDAEKAKFAKDSLEFEMLAVKDSLQNKNKVLKEALKAIQLKNHEKKEKLIDLETQVQELQSEILSVKQKSQTELDKTQKDCEALQDELRRYKRKLEAQGLHENNAELLESIKAECEDLKLKYVRSLHNNDKLIKKVIDLKQKQVNARQEVMKLTNRLRASTEPNTPLRNQSQNSPWAIKAELNKIYKDFIGEIQRSTDGNNSFYTMQSGQFSNIEKRLNELISLLHETLEENENENEDDLFNKLETGFDEKLHSGRMTQDAGARNWIDGCKKRASSLRPSFNSHN